VGTPTRCWRFSRRGAIANWRLTTAREQTIDEYGLLTRNLFTLPGWIGMLHHRCRNQPVVPPVNRTFCGDVTNLFWEEALFRGNGVKTGMAVLVDNPSEVGADRIVNGGRRSISTAGRALWWILGRRFTFDAISRRAISRGASRQDWDFVGGVVCAGARLPRVEIKDREGNGTNTVTHMQAGLYYGAVDMVDGMLARMR